VTTHTPRATTSRDGQGTRRRGSGIPQTAPAQRALAVIGVLVCLAASAAALAVAPTLMPASYSWVAHTTSESAAQGVPGAWVARLGLLTFGFAVLALVSLARDTWGRLAAWLHAAFGVLMIAAAAFSARSWETDVPFDAVEDVLHSVAATAMGSAFAFGVTAVAWRVWRAGGGLRWLDAAAVTASVVLPLAMMNWEQLAGVLQRPMFAIAFAWYAVEALRARPADRDSARSHR
jgi:hypothetical protein